MKTIIALMALLGVFSCYTLTGNYSGGMNMRAPSLGQYHDNRTG